jgi:predicted dehydrogenase
VADYLQGIETGQPAQPDFRSGLRTQKVCDGVLTSARTGKWVDIV